MNLKVLVILFILASCSIEKSEIRYGEEVCDHCHMVIIDSRYGSELLTDKGKAYKFDAIECLIRFKKENQSILIQTLLL